MSVCLASSSWSRRTGPRSVPATSTRSPRWDAVGIESQKSDACSHSGMTLSFTPTKVALDILDSCNKRLRSLANELPGVFVHGDADDFVETSTVVLRQFADNVLRPSEELGMPFVEMVEQLRASGKKQLKFKSGGVEYQAKEDVITEVDYALSCVQKKFDAMVLTTP
mmetsp:Transcript_124296/g.351877  ORF Transcript_124296/g.351877 Transcript_124296/m.351877 type:complete len:167 (+) Transcript_124296:1150-1650(+)